MAITAALVKELREQTGVGMMDCKKALNETNGDLEAAVDWLRTKGLAKAAKKAGRVAAEGLVGVVTSGTKGAVVEVNSETDFVARNAEFQGLVNDIATLALEKGDDVEQLAAATYPGKSHSVADEVTNAVAKIGENMTLRRSATVSVDEGVVCSYVHNAVVDGLGGIGILVGLKTSGDASKLEGIGRQLAMHIAATNPLAISPEGLDQDVVDRERAVFAEQAAGSGKPAEIVEKMVEGRMRKYYEEVCLLSQTFVIDGETKVGDVVKNAEKEAGAPVELVDFKRFAIGEGIEKEESDFAAEVAAAAGN
ncbi:translation elongation factor Ts [Maritalea mediterranea]|uniref:Elongation factor Ts n=1 Tax=Maritalea mediterranea TaxID=2909667 RepID=A0ABS9E701_9HYPH|nr:translation elongation factor Ts [Maritalea mediterranea]MCF4098563.1 translation elongation factor Ts [Maritalea mediterranea]